MTQAGARGRGRLELRKKHGVEVEKERAASPGAKQGPRRVKRAISVKFFFGGDGTSIRATTPEGGAH